MKCVTCLGSYKSNKEKSEANKLFVTFNKIIYFPRKQGKNTKKDLRFVNPIQRLILEFKNISPITKKF